MRNALARLWRAVTRERAVICGLALAVLEAVSRGEITKATAVPVLAGIVLRFFVTPYDRRDQLDAPGEGGVAG